MIGRMTSLGGDCADVDECSAGRSPCEQVCVNEPGSYRCSCRRGFTAMTHDPRRCEGALIVELRDSTHSRMRTARFRRRRRRL